MVKVFRQGDVVLKETILPTNSIKVSEKLKVSSETGNDHVMDVPVYEHYGQTCIMVEQETPLTHPQHETIIVAPGVYEVSHVRDALDVGQRD